MFFILFALFSCAFGFCHSDGRTYCLPTAPCWPSQTAINQLAATLTGDLVQPVDPKDDGKFTPGTSYYWATMGLLKNRRFLTKPGIIVVVANDNDVKDCISFARQYNIKLAVISSGHDYIGRNTAYGSLQINLYNLRGVSVNVRETQYSDGGTAVLGVGNNLAKVYEELSTVYNRVVVGGASPKVSFGGYTLGGGHSPITRMKGLAVDNVIQLNLITANGSTALVDKGGYSLTDSEGVTTYHQDPDLFWALRGGGGGTFGIVTWIKYKLHLPPDQFQSLSCVWGFGLNQQDATPAKEFLKFYGKFLQTFPRSWGGYLLIAPPIPLYNIPYGWITLSLVHWGDYAEAIESSKDLFSWHPEWARPEGCQISNHSSFWDYIHFNNDTVYERQYIFSASVQPETWATNFTDDLVDSMMSLASKLIFVAGTATHVGGRAKEFPGNSSSVVSGFRSADLALTMGVGLSQPMPATDPYIMNQSKEVSSVMYKYINSGYYNEPDSEKPDWKTFYWGDKYPALLRVKQKWDPDNTFTCLHCVGSDLV